MDEFDDSLGEKLRASAAAAGERPWDVTAESITRGSKRRPGAPVSSWARPAMILTAATSGIAATWHSVVHGYGWTLRRFAALAFVAVAITGATLGVLASTSPRPPHHGSAAPPTTQTTAGVTTSAPSTTAPPPSSTTTVAPSSTTTSTSPPPTTTTATQPLQGLSGYQQVTNSTSVSCADGGPNPNNLPSCGSGPQGSVTAACPSGEQVLGGGGSVSVTPSMDAFHSAFLQESVPTQDGSGWTAAGSCWLSGIDSVDYTLTVTATAICAFVTQSSS